MSNNDTLTLYKLMILFLLDKVDFPLTNAQISGFLLGKEYTNYFTIQQVISDLSEAEFIRCETIRNSSYFQITDSGEETLEYFGDQISDAIKQDILLFLKENKYNMREEVSTTADYFEQKKGEYVARMRVTEQGSPLIELSLTLSTEDAAAVVCNNWKACSQDIYGYLMTMLMQENNSGRILE